MANKNTKWARSKGYASLWDMNNNGTKIVKGVCVNTARIGRKRWQGAANASKRDGK